MVRFGVVGMLTIQAILLISSGCAKNEEVAEKKREFSLPVQIGKVLFMDVVDRVRTVGNVRAEQRVIINAEVEGQITQIRVEEGDEVRTGDLLARIDFREYELEVEELEAAMAAAQE